MTQRDEGDSQAQLRADSVMRRPMVLTSPGRLTTMVEEVEEPEPQSSPFALIPDAPGIIGALLRQHPEVMALDARVAGKLPASFTKPWVKVTQLDATNVTGGQPEHLINFYLQFDCYAGSTADNAQAEASRLGRTIRAVLHNLTEQDIPEVVVTQVAFTGDARIPDEAFEPARERVVLDAEVRMHVR